MARLNRCNQRCATRRFITRIHAVTKLQERLYCRAVADGARKHQRARIRNLVEEVVE